VIVMDIGISRLHPTALVLAPPYSPPRRLFAPDIDNAIGDTAIGVRLAVVARNI